MRLGRPPCFSNKSPLGGAVSSLARSLIDVCQWALVVDATSERNNTMWVLKLLLVCVCVVVGT